MFPLPKKPGRALASALGLAIVFGSGAVRAQDNGADGGGPDDSSPARAKARANPPQAAGQDEKKYRDYNDVVKNAQRIDGFITLHRKDDHLYAEIRPHQFDQPVVA